MKGRLGLFAICSLALWLSSSAVAFFLWPGHRQGVLACSGAAFVLCLLPTIATFLWSHWVINHSPQQQLVSVLGGTGIRMFFVLGVGLLLASSVPLITEYRKTFWLWVLIYYLSTLAMEMALIVRGQQSAAREHHTKSNAAPSP